MSQDSFSDPRFVERIRARDQEALSEVVEAYLGHIRRAALGAGLTPDEAEEATQATFATFLEVVPRFEGRSHVRTFLFGIFYRKLKELRRSFAKDRKMEDIDEVFESRFDEKGSWSRPPRPADADLESAELRQEIGDCLEGAPDRQKVAFVLREVQELETEEICKILDVTSTNLGVMLFRVRNRLRECLEAKGVR